MKNEKLFNEATCAFTMGAIPKPEDYKRVLKYSMNQMFPEIKIKTQDLNKPDRNDHTFYVVSEEGAVDESK